MKPFFLFWSVLKPSLANLRLQVSADDPLTGVMQGEAGTAAHCNLGQYSFWLSSNSYTLPAGTKTANYGHRLWRAQGGFSPLLHHPSW
jgi:hypothetical protein